MATIDQKSGVFAGLAAEEIPAAGSLALGKPKNFVAMQWGEGTPPTPPFFQTSEFVIASDNGSFPDMFHYLNVDFENETYNIIGTFDYGANYNSDNIATDGNTVLKDNGPGSLKQYTWDGSVFTEVADVPLLGGNASKCDLVSADGRLIQEGVGNFDDYSSHTVIPTVAPWTWPAGFMGTTQVSAGGAFDLCRPDEKDVIQLGTMFVDVPDTQGQNLTTFELTPTDINYIFGLPTTGIASYHSFGTDRYLGKIYSAFETEFQSWTVDTSTGVISYDGSDVLEDGHCVAGSQGFVVIFEHIGVDDVLSTYTESGGLLTLVDRKVIFPATSPANTNQGMWASPWTGNVYIGATNTPFAASISDTGVIGNPIFFTPDIQQNSAPFGTPFAFLKDQLAVTP